MDKYAPELLDLGLGAMIGKGKRSQEVKDAHCKKWFCLLCGSRRSRRASFQNVFYPSEVIAYDDLGTEAIRKLQVKDFPVIVVIDSEGNNLYETAILDYKRES